MISKWLRKLARLFNRGKTKLYDGCSLCYGSGVVCLTSRNKHFIEGVYYRECPNGCKMTEFGQSKIR